MTLFLTIVAMGLVTYAIRLSMIVLWERISLPPLVQQGLRFVPPAVLSAIIFPEVLQPGGVLDISLGNERLVAGLLAAVVAWRTGSVVWTLSLGMGMLWLWQLLG